LLPPGEDVLMFSMTSGTTGNPKYIPVTSRFLTHLRRGWNILGVNVLSMYPAAQVRPILQISSSMDEEKSPTGLPCGAISGMLASTQKKIVRKMYVAPKWTTLIEDPTDRFYTLMRFAVERDVAIITTANPSSTIKLIETARDHCEHLIRDLADGTFLLPSGNAPPKENVRKFSPNTRLAGKLDQAVRTDGELLPRHFWNVTFLTNWTGGTLLLYLKHLRKLFGDIPIHGIGLVASEGRFSIPLESNTPSGVAEVLSSCLEFIPAEERESKNPVVLRSHELEVGQEYFLVFSNYTGFFRYNLDDRIRVTDMQHQTPVFEFLSRGLFTSNITGEKLTESHVVDAMKKSGRDMGVDIELFEMQGRFASPPFYELRVEMENPEHAEKLCGVFDNHLREINIEYDSKRKSQRLGPVRPVLLPSGTLNSDELQKIIDHKGRTEQYKHRYLLTEILED